MATRKKSTRKKSTAVRKKSTTVRKKATSKRKPALKKVSKRNLSDVMKDASQMLESGAAKTRASAMKKAWAKAKK